MKIILVDGVFDLIGCYTIKDPRDDFIRHASVDHMMSRQFAISLNADDAERRRAILEADNQFALRVQHYGGTPAECDVVSKDHFQNSAPGFIYLVDSIDGLRHHNPGCRTLLLLRDPTQDMYLDITIDPYKFGYGLELPDTELPVGQNVPYTDPTVMAWLAVEPGICNPLRIEPVEYVNRDYLHHMVYQ